MYMEDDTMTPRDRISDDMLRRMLDYDSSDNQTSPLRDAPSTQHRNTERRTWGLANYPLASVYAPLQDFRKIYDRDTALRKGTIFSEMDLPFMGRSIMKGGSCRG